MHFNRYVSKAGSLCPIIGTVNRAHQKSAASLNYSERSDARVQSSAVKVAVAAKRPALVIHVLTSCQICHYFYVVPSDGTCHTCCAGGRDILLFFRKIQRESNLHKQNILKTIRNGSVYSYI